MKQPSDTANSKLLRKQLFKFVITGACAALLDFGILTLLMSFGSEYIWAKAISFVFGTTTAYLFNRRWTFQAEASKRKFFAVVGLYAVTFVVQVGIWAVMFPLFLGWLQHELLAQLCGFVLAQGVATTVNFMVQRTVIFK